jgi:hypothetical protein
VHLIRPAQWAVSTAGKPHVYHVPIRRACGSLLESVLCTVFNKNTGSHYINRWQCLLSCKYTYYETLFLDKRELRNKCLYLPILQQKLQFLNICNAIY